jgi:integration host factor subunit alpha
MPDKTNKEELIDLLAIRTGFKRQDIHSLIDDLMKELIKSMLNGKTIELRGFGTFEIKKRKGRTNARNPKTGEIVSIEDHGVAVFRPGKELKVKAWKAIK